MGVLGGLHASSQQQEHSFQMVGDDEAIGEADSVQVEGETTLSSWGSSPSTSATSELPASATTDEDLLSPVIIKVIGVGGGGGNAVDGMITTATRKLAGVEFVAMNTDTQALTKSRAEIKIALGSDVTRGLGAGGKPKVGEAAAIESLPEIEKILTGSDMVFVTAGMGGGTGTGAAPVIAQAARDLGCVTVAVVTQPFSFEGRQRSKQAAAGLEELREAADTVLVVANDRLLEIVPGRMTMSDAFLVADDVLRQGVIGTSEIIVRPGLINVDFADVREIIKNSGTALIGIGTGTGKSRAEDAAVGAMCSPLLDFPIDQARGVVFNIVGGLDMSLTEVNAAARIIQRNVHPDANIIVGALVDERCGQQVSVTVLATGFEAPEHRSGANPGGNARGQGANGQAGGAGRQEVTATTGHNQWQPYGAPQNGYESGAHVNGRINGNNAGVRQNSLGRSRIRSPSAQPLDEDIWEEDGEWEDVKLPGKRIRGVFRRLFGRGD